MLKVEWTNRDSLGCSNITCANCQYNDGMVYTSMPPQYKCTITNEFHHNNDKCDVEFTPIKHGHWVKSLDHYDRYMCSVCGHLTYIESDNYCSYCGAKMGEAEND